MNFRLMFAIMIVCGALRALAGCSAAQTKTDEAAAGYTSQQEQCIAQYADRASIDRCRARVKAAWATDAGSDASEGGDR